MLPLASDESSGDDDMPQLVSSSDEETSDEESDEETANEETSDEETSDEEASDDDMPDLVSDDDDIVHMMIRDTNCSICRGAIQTLMNHEHNSSNSVEEHSKNEIPPMITYTLWLFILLHALNLLSNLGGFCRSR
jgi:hypothetical protein